MSYKAAGYLCLLIEIIFALIGWGASGTFIIIGAMYLLADEIIKEIRECKNQTTK